MCVSASLLYRKLSLFLRHGHLGMGCALNPCHRLLRQFSHYKSGVVTAADLVSYWEDVFEANEIPEPQASSEYIVSHVLGAKTFQNLSAASISTPLSSKQVEDVEQLCAKRLQRMPVQYVLGEWDFQDLTLKMEPPVFIPRPETEELVSLVVAEECRKRLNSSGCRDPCLSPHGPLVLEVGCGSGAIALSILKKLPHSQAFAIDKSEAAVNLTKQNAQRLNLQDRISVFHHDVFSSSWECLLPCGFIDTVISNPPYVFHEDMTHLAAEILSYEDLDALDGGDDGMSVIKEILNRASYSLKDSGSIFLEVDPRHPEMVKNWLGSHPDLFLFLSATHKDFCGNADEAVQTLDQCLDAVMEWTKANRLKLNPDKTEVMFFGTSPSGYGGPFPTLEGVSLRPSDTVRNLGVVLDPALTMEAQVAAVSRTAFFHLHRIAQIHPYLDGDSLRMVVQALVISRLDYCNTLYMGLPLTLLWRLQWVQNAVARLVAGVHRFDHITPVLACLHWLPVASRIDSRSWF